MSRRDIEVPFGVPESFDEHIKLHFDLQALAFQGDITRVSSLMIARDVSLRSYPESGITDRESPRFAPRRGPEAARGLGDDQSVPHEVLRAFPQEAVGYARWRRQRCSTTR